MEKKNWIQVGALIKPADGSSYRGIITRITHLQDGEMVDVYHQNVDGTGLEYHKCVFGFFCRYSPVEDEA